VRYSPFVNPQLTGHSPFQFNHRGPAWAGRVVVSIVLAAVACGGPVENHTPPNILLISIDALRADHLGCYDYDRPTSPILDRLASRGTRFSKAFANTHGTPPSHTTLLSSLYQESHRVGIPRNPSEAALQSVPNGVAMVQEILSDNGWHTLAVTGGGYMSADFGFARGFDSYNDRARKVDRAEKILVDALRRTLVDDRPVFAFLHTYQVHSPYAPPERFLNLFGEHSSTLEPTSEALIEIQGRAAEILSRGDFDFLEALYDGEIRFTDEILGKLLDSLDEIGFLGNTVIIVTADHGEEFGEHGGVLHGGKLFDELLHVPLIITGRGIRRGFVDPSLVSLIDIAPTVLSLAGLAVPATMEGRNLLDRPTTRPWNDQRVFAQYGDRLYCVRTPRWKLIEGPDVGAIRLFDLRGDSSEQRDARLQYPELAEQLTAELDAWRAGRQRPDLGERDEVQYSQETTEDLRALGYVQ
jgi:arylsulfatase A-like enzyme